MCNIALLPRGRRQRIIWSVGNHTYSHPDLNTIPLDQFQADVLRGETVTRALLNERGQTPRLLRHPFLHVGASLETRRAFEAFLADHGYIVAPVAIDNDEFVYAVYAGRHYSEPIRSPEVTLLAA